MAQVSATTGRSPETTLQVVCASEQTGNVYAGRPRPDATGTARVRQVPRPAPGWRGGSSRSAGSIDSGIFIRSVPARPALIKSRRAARLIEAVVLACRHTRRRGHRAEDLPVVFLPPALARRTDGSPEHSRSSGFRSHWAALVGSNCAAWVARSRACGDYRVWHERSSSSCPAGGIRNCHDLDELLDRSTVDEAARCRGIRRALRHRPVAHLLRARGEALLC